MISTQKSYGSETGSQKHHQVNQHVLSQTLVVSG